MAVVLMITRRQTWQAGLSADGVQHVAATFRLNILKNNNDFVLQAHDVLVVSRLAQVLWLSAKTARLRQTDYNAIIYLRQELDQSIQAFSALCKGRL